MTKVIELKPEDKVVLLERGLLYQQLMQHETAIKDFNQALVLDP